VKIAEAITEISETEPVEKPEPPKRSLRKHPSFETWIQGSPHDSDEYDTDIDIDDYVKSMLCTFIDILYTFIHLNI
jgi:hypothetical protein